MKIFGRTLPGGFWCRNDLGWGFWIGGVCGYRLGCQSLEWGFWKLRELWAWMGLDFGFFVGASGAIDVEWNTLANS